MTRSRLRPALLVVAALVVGACGGSEGTDAPTSSGSSATDSSVGTSEAAPTGDAASTGPGATSEPTPSGSAGATTTHPVTIEHAMGETTIESRPQRVVSLSVQWTDALLAMGVQPTAYVLDQASGETNPFPWQDGLLEQSTRIDSTGEVPFEEIARLDPDVILATFNVTDPDIFSRLEAIAPTIGLLGDRQVDRWQDQVEVLGRALGESDRAEQVVTDVESQVDAVADELPGLEGKTYVLANYVPNDAIYVVADPEDGASELFNRLEMRLPPGLLEAADDVTGRVQLSFEQVGLLESDLLGILPNEGDPHDLPGYDRLTAVQGGAVAEMAFADVVGVNTPTPISIAHVLELLRPALEAAAGS